ncbi:PREDICTED: LEAF RUST 10 DISEASE-RESISTANCE LOCUS RECEPTOR-LIKE PROTEIN KINASE-like 2.7 [Nelumbo nucifera]|uniref:LEAF RUST 10 DISEASE-RESISTANCE LOCUS RECEPTOR-LIKE PROTEIN KINASE-like 2.7 n=1 Tax=Nelumbo nucifera TaxID=4432 RepID=A0A1U7ZIM3_NELNU|nr:PREDICTED: LEAF RUST 10 DISEASE-RESISTANCE LOCUS RECEPTOR-LIKE PROTEIN KINASE-like 2.7 [Nelumbo nucifera]XP_010265924.1 PREDICTED: LEAF RUST 10 DISEASE-RESISTANCE LOCUS RECEPTOR-LIKE PROTEIN KINASE-like 2.7 [Nelumbo nucifera]
MTPHLFLFFFIFVILLLSLDLPLSRCEYVVDYSRYFDDCSQLSFNCGNIQNIRYPFWGDERPDYCGLPGFKLHCDADHHLTTTIEINSVTYKVSSMDYKNQNLKVAQADLLDSICQKKQKSINTTSLILPPSSPSSERYMALFYGCSPSPSSGVMDGATKVSVSCPSNGDPAEVYYVLDDSFAYENLASKCQEGNSVIVPIPSIAKAEIEKNSSRFGEIISQDVDLRWSSSIDVGCSGCLSYKGQCGWNWELNTSTCFCEFETYEGRCAPPHAAPDSHLDPSPSPSPGTYQFSGASPDE